MKRTAYQNQWFEDNKEHVKAYSKDYYQEHKQYYIDKSMQWIKEHPEQKKEYAARYRATHDRYQEEKDRNPVGLFKRNCKRYDKNTEVSCENSAK